jgi:VIT1/CCC1 family predicted Fe2+/Mn2+ transporter
MASAASFAAGAALPVLAVWLAPAKSAALVTAVTSVFFLAALGAVAAQAGGASMRTAALRVAVWGALAMAVTAGCGWLFDAAVG